MNKYQQISTNINNYEQTNINKYEQYQQTYK